MKILFLYDFPIKGGGSGYYLKYLALRLQEKYRHKIGIVLPSKEIIHPSFSHYYVPIKNPPVFVGRPGLENSKKYSQLNQREIVSIYQQYLATLINALEDFHPDIVHTHHLAIHTWAARFAQPFYPFKHVITSHGSCLFNIIQDRRYMSLSKDSLRTAHMISTVSGDNRTKLRKMFGSDFSKKIRTTPGGVRKTLFPEQLPKPIREELIKKFKLPSDKPLILFSGRLVQEKGVEYLIKASHLINAHIIIAGDGPQKDRYLKLIQERNIKNVQFLGYLDHETLIHLYYLAYVFVSPSVWDDPMPLSIVEAMAAKCPVVVTKKGGIPIAVKDGLNGFFVRPRNSSQIAEKVNALINNPSLRDKMGERARQVVSSRFTWSKVAEKFHHIYKKI